MEPKALYTRLQTVGIPVAYDRFAKKTQPPFLIWYIADAESISADGKNFGEKQDVRVLLCTKKRDVALELQTEAAIAPLSYSKTATYLTDEEMYQVTYEVQTIERRR